MPPTIRGGLDTGGFDGGFFDGRYVYFVPWTRTVPADEDKSTYHANFLRYDTRGAFDDPSELGCGTRRQRHRRLENSGL